jgi:hypothetical protein
MRVDGGRRSDAVRATRQAGRGNRRYAAGAALAVLLAFAAMVFAGGSAQAASADDLATRFHVDITVNDDGSIDVAENITWHFPDGEDRHGIERYVTVRVGYQDRDDTYREYPISDVSATSPSGARPTCRSTTPPTGPRRASGSGEPTRR